MGQDYHLWAEFGESKDMRKINIASIVLCTLSLSGMAGADIVVDNQSIPGADIQAITISPSSGHIFITTKDGYTVEKNGGGTTEPPPPPPGGVAISSFTISPTNLLVGGVISINWNTSNAVSCAATGGTGPWQMTSFTLPSGARNLTMNDPGTLVFTMTCTGQSGDTATRSVTVVVNEVVPSSCPTTTLSGGVEEWKSFWLVDFPLPTYQNRFASIPRFGYKAIRFNTGNIVDNGKFTTIETTQTDGVRFGTITECPGDFGAAVPNSCRYVWGLGGGVSWATDGKAGACQLQPNKDYYFNLTFTDGTDKTKSTCTSTPCVTEIQHINF